MKERPTPPKMKMDDNSKTFFLKRKKTKINRRINSIIPTMSEYLIFIPINNDKNKIRTITRVESHNYVFFDK